MDQNPLADAERLYQDALVRAEHLPGFGRAKTCFEVLEGLAKAALMGGSPEEALGYLIDAENEARVSFEASSRSIARISRRLVEVQTLVRPGNHLS